MIKKYLYKRALSDLGNVFNYKNVYKNNNFMNKKSIYMKTIILSEEREYSLKKLKNNTYRWCKPIMSFLVFM